MPSINFGNTGEKIRIKENPKTGVKAKSSDANKIIFNKQDVKNTTNLISDETEVKESKPENPKLQILDEEKINVFLERPSRNTIEIAGDPGPVGPTGPPGGSRYFYGNEAPTVASIGDKWFQPLTGIEFSRIQDYWVQLYENKQKKLFPVFTRLFLSGNTIIDEQTILNISLINESSVESVEWRIQLKD